MSTSSPIKSQTLPPVHNPNSPNPNAPIFRPSPARATSLTGTPFQYKTRAASQPAGERIPPSSTPGSGRGSPGMNGTNGVGGGAFGVIGGSRAPGRFSNALAGGTQTRANSFSAGEVREPRNTVLNRTLSSHTEEFFPSRSQSTSPFPTFSPNSTPSTSPAAIRQHPLPPSPPKAGANSSRSRSQSLATGVRPTNIDRPWFGTMSTLENVGAFSKADVGWNISPNEGSNMSPFSRGLPSLGNNPAREEMYGKNGVTPSGGRFKDGIKASVGPAWGASPPDTTALSSSVHKALGSGYGQGQPFTGGMVGNAYGESNGGNRSGASSRRHSVSVVGGPGGRREFAFGEPGMGITSMSPPSRGLFGFESDLGNALSLDIDQSKRTIRDGEVSNSGSLPKFGFGEPGTGHQRISSINRPKNEEIFPSFGSTPPRGRLETFGISGERTTSGESNGNSKRFPLENAAVGSPIVGHERIANGHSNGLTGSPEGTKDLSLSTSTIKSSTSVPGPGPGAIGTPGAGPQPPPSFIPGQSPYPIGARPYGNLPPPPPGGPTPGLGLMNNGSPGQGMLGGPSGFGRPPLPPQGYYGMPPNRPPPGVQGYNGPGPGHSLPPLPPPGSAYVGAGPYSNQPPPPFYPNNSPPQPTSPSFSTLSLSDLGKGIPLGSLPITTPLYIVTFKAGRRDIYYCPDPTLLISNGDKVIVEADRGSDLGTVIYDQLTPNDIRDWQERQATAALLSGASQHQPPGLAVSGQLPQQQQQVQQQKRLSGEFGVPPELSNMDLDGLLIGCGPSGQPDLAGSTIVRGPLAKELTPKRIFAKSSQGTEEQNRMREKLNDEYEAMMICREKVMQRGLPMQIVDAEYQWDRRKLTFYFKADKRVDFRDLTKENFRIFKSRIWMSMVPKDDPRG
ncbi:hypothetical protein L486_04753 [Kwoniella mangroviensis CBS 10435]|uniref:PSP1 C-terminal domain-containing protein n=1 Tax=Kwoniella mangroviensis CBS 10435 TaxID=1331196 RepID=A0A1B9IP42_9TREE|nr:hypothetical protein L486_04753 [Kwoniella mangroviensis CBS 10435]